MGWLRTPASLLVLNLLLALLCRPASAQEPLRVQVNLVNVSFTARDGSDRLVGDLSKDDVNVIEDASPQKIAFFSRAPEVPLTLGLVVDESGSQDHFTKQHQHDLEMFLANVLRPGDRAFLICFGNHVRLVSDFTSSPAALLDALRTYQHEGGKHFPELDPDDSRDLGTAFYDAIYAAVSGKFAGAQGRRALLVFSDGEDNSSAHTMMETLEAAQVANVQLHMLRYTEQKHGQLTARNRYGTSVMTRLAAETGTTSIDTSATEPQAYFRQIADELRLSYDLAYYPTNPLKDQTFRKISIQSRQPGITIRARTGYFSR